MIRKSIFVFFSFSCCILNFDCESLFGIIDLKDIYVVDLQKVFFPLMNLVTWCFKSIYFL